MAGASKLLMLISAPFPLLCPHPAAALRLAARRHRIALAVAVPGGRFLHVGARRCPGLTVRAAEQVHTQAAAARDGYGEASAPLTSVRTATAAAGHPLPEWTRLVEHVTAAGYSGRWGSAAAREDGDSFSDSEGLTEEFVKAAEACLSFARDRPDLLRLLSKKDIQIVVENGSPFLFKNGESTARRLRSFLSGNGINVLDSERAKTIDVMRYLLSYLSNPRVASDENYIKDGELVESSTRNLLVDMVNMSAAGQEPSFTESAPRQPSLTQDQFSRPPGQNIEMKRGDWICPKCSFMNFARNMRCLECNDARPKRVLTGGEWECPQCDFFNYGRNMSCLRCDCKRPGETLLNTASPGASLGQSSNLNVEQILNRSGIDKTEIERKLAANDEKAERWFSKVSQLDDTSDLSSAIADEDFPEIMPMRKGVNRFVVSTRKTPLERRLANAQNKSNESQPGSLGGMGSGRTSESSISQTLDRILGHTSTSSGSNNQPTAVERNAGAGNRFNASEYLQGTANQRRNSDHVPFVPLPSDMFHKSQNSNDDVQQSPNKGDSASMKADQPNDFVPTTFRSPAESKNEKESSDAAERWSRKVTELDNITDSASAVSDDDFPEIMPMRKGENRFVISKKKDRSLTSPQYKRRMALEQANNSNFVPFVPFPPDYFAKKDKQPEASPTMEASQGSVPPEKVHAVPEKWEESKTSASNWGSVGNIAQQPQSQANNWSRTETHFADFPIPGKNTNESISGGVGAANTAHSPSNTWYDKKESQNSGYSEKSTFSIGNTTTSSPQQSENTQNVKDGWNRGYTGMGGYSEKSTFSGSSTRTSSPQQPGNTQNIREGWNQGYTGRSLEGSAVKEPDPLDMSEEAKAERWFRRVAQIKDISELSNIPDEDFPEIMPMRKGVNRFVVSKRKTPLERRLTSPQYRRNLPIVSSEPDKDAS